MDNQGNHNANSEEYQRYLEGSMTPKERHDFEKRLLADDFESEALEGYTEINPADISKDISFLRDKLKSETRRSSTLTYWRIAAAILLFCAFSFVVYFLIDENTTSQIVQSKKEPQDKEELLALEKNEVLVDSMIEDVEPIIAYQQQADKIAGEKLSAQPARIQAVPAEEELEIEENEPIPEVVVESFAEVSEKTEVQGAEPVELSIVAHEDAQVEIDPQNSKNSIAAIETVPLAAMDKNRNSTSVANLRTVTGKIVSMEDDEPIPGVNVVVKGSNIGTVSDMEGNYKIDVPKDEEVILTYSFIGLNSAEIEVKDQENIDVSMEPNISGLSEIIVVSPGASAGAKKASNSYIAPRPEGEYGKFKNYVSENIRYPASGIEEKIRGTVRLKFTVGMDGQLSDIEILKSLGDDFDTEAIRLLNEGPAWEPAQENGIPVIRDVNIKIRFRPPL